MPSPSTIQTPPETITFTCNDCGEAKEIPAADIEKTGAAARCYHCGGMCSIKGIPDARGTYTDSQRLDYLLRFLSIDDVGDDNPCSGVVVRGECLSEALTSYQAPGIDPVHLVEFGDPLRRVIDRAIEARAGGVPDVPVPDGETRQERLRRTMVAFAKTLSSEDKEVLLIALLMKRAVDGGKGREWSALLHFDADKEASAFGIPGFSSIE